jgi:hypothetical protein
MTAKRSTTDVRVAALSVEARATSSETARREGAAVAVAATTRAAGEEVTAVIATDLPVATTDAPTAGAAAAADRGPQTAVIVTAGAIRETAVCADAVPVAAPTDQPARSLDVTNLAVAAP